MLSHNKEGFTGWNTSYTVNLLEITIKITLNNQISFLATEGENSRLGGKYKPSKH